jgi:hypothetical protein
MAHKHSSAQFSLNKKRYFCHIYWLDDRVSISDREFCKEGGAGRLTTYL